MFKSIGYETLNDRSFCDPIFGSRFLHGGTRFLNIINISLSLKLGYEICFEGSFSNEIFSCLFSG